MRRVNYTISCITLRLQVIHILFYSFSLFTHEIHTASPTRVCVSHSQNITSILSVYRTCLACVGAVQRILVPRAMLVSLSNLTRCTAILQHLYIRTLFTLLLQNCKRNTNNFVITLSHALPVVDAKIVPVTGCYIQTPAIG